MKKTKKVAKKQKMVREPQTIKGLTSFIESFFKKQDRKKSKKY